MWPEPNQAVKTNDLDHAGWPQSVTSSTQFYPWRLKVERKLQEFALQICPVHATSGSLGTGKTHGHRWESQRPMTLGSEIAHDSSFIHSSHAPHSAWTNLISLAPLWKVNKAYLLSSHPNIELLRMCQGKAKLVVEDCLVLGVSVPRVWKLVTRCIALLFSKP